MDDSDRRARGRPLALVTGDRSADWQLMLPVATSSSLQVTYQWESRGSARIVAQPGSAALLTDLLAATGGDDIETRGVEIPPEALAAPAFEGVARVFSVWQPFPAGEGASGWVWRMQQLLGVQPASDGGAAVARALDDGAAGSMTAPDCVAIEDASLGFRDNPAAWPACLTDPDAQPRHLILKMSNPLGQGRLWEELTRRHAERLTVYCSANDLRKEFAPLGQALSWERTASDVVNAVREREDLRSVARVVVSLGLNGAVVVERQGQSVLVFDPTNQEGDWERDHPGLPVGIGSCLTAALAYEAATQADAPNWPMAAARGLAAGRALHLSRKAVPGNGGELDGEGFTFSLDEIGFVARGSGATDPFMPIAIPDDSQWRIFESASSRSYPDLAANIVTDGDLKACREMPVERMGAWASIDRTEIESMRSVRNIMHEYMAQGRRSRPLSIAVFGPPGSGKSFAIKQMARGSVPGGARVAILEFNLSQLSSPEELPAALQRVRDCTVGETLPLVFWDEFDTPLGGRELGWLSHFLAPMQDGVFLEHGNARPIGPAIFIFAGGTHTTKESFATRALEIPSAKATDFLSRLRGYVDILGPNRSGPEDETYMMRRALLLRALLLQKAGGLFQRGELNIDPGVLRAFINVSSYVHGARSMESIVDMSALSGKTRYERSTLPPQHQLSLHVDAEEFLRLVRGESSER